MLSENIRTYRKAKGLSQEELAAKLNVVRQTISKWEKGLSVPDSEMLILLAETFEVSVAELLGETVSWEEAPTLQSLAMKLELLNEQFAKRAERSRKIWKGVFVVIGCISILILLFELIPLVSYLLQANSLLIGDSSIAVIGGADGPTAIFVTSAPVKIPSVLVATLALVISLIGLRRIK